MMRKIRRLLRKKFVLKTKMAERWVRFTVNIYPHFSKTVDYSSSSLFHNKTWCSLYFVALMWGRGEGYVLLQRKNGPESPSHIRQLTLCICFFPFHLFYSFIHSLLPLPYSIHSFIQLCIHSFVHSIILFLHLFYFLHLEGKDKSQFFSYCEVCGRFENPSLF